MEHSNQNSILEELEYALWTGNLANAQMYANRLLKLVDEKGLVPTGYGFADIRAILKFILNISGGYDAED